MKLKKFYNSIKSKKTKYFFDSKDIYKEINNYLLSKKSFSKVLDLGCGDLRNLKYLKNIKFKNYIAVDWVLPPFKNLKNPKITFVKKDLKKFSTSEKFDLIFLVGTIEHFKKPNIFLKKIKGFMKRGSLLIISHPNYYNIRGSILLTCKYLFKKKISLSDVKYFYPEEVSNILKKLNFKKITVKSIRNETNKIDINYLDLKNRLPKILGASKKKQINEFLKKYQIMKKYLKSDKFSGQNILIFAHS